jgi:hypothetical protein
LPFSAPYQRPAGPSKGSRFSTYRLVQILGATSVDWTQTRVAFVSPSFTENQIQATNFKDIAIELWEVKRYENNTIVINEVKKSRSAESIKPITQQNKELKRVTDEIVVYTEDDLLVAGSNETRELYYKFKDGILNLADEVPPINSLPRVTYN